MTRVVVIGAGIGGLTTAATLARRGMDVTVLESHVYPGGCAGTFYHQGYRFDAGATLAGGFYPGGPMDLVAQATDVSGWEGRPSDAAMVVHLPDGTGITRWGDDRRRAERRAAFGPESEEFWRWQEQTADAMWALALRTPTWPPQSAADSENLLRNGLSWLKESRPNLASMLQDFNRPLATRLKNAPDHLRLFIDAQLLISAQATSRTANALYGASALDLPRRGVMQLKGGMGAIGETLAEAVRRNGGEVKFKQHVTRIVMENSRPVAVETKRKKTFPADVVVANLPPWNIACLLGENAPRRLQNLPPKPKDGWGAFVVYIGIDDAAIPVSNSTHHQLILREPMGEGNTLFLSLNPAWDTDRAPQGKRTLTISTHTRLDHWWTRFEQDRPAYEQLKQTFTENILTAAERVIPNLRESAHLVLPGTPVTFQRFTHRTWGWVGGFPQTNLFKAWGPRLVPNLWMVGDSIFPGQSTAAVALGGLRVANHISRAHHSFG